jgi:hypothetical protein
MQKKNEHMPDTFSRIEGIKKRIKCKGCGKMIEVENFNRLYCITCGYRSRHVQKPTRKSSEGKRVCPPQLLMGKAPTHVEKLPATFGTP